MPTHRSTARPAARTAAAVAVSAALAAAGGLAVAAPALAGADVSRTAGNLHAYAPSSTLERVPAGATGRLQAVATPRGTTTFTFTVTGMLPDATYGAHLHVAPCDVEGGPHFQFVPPPPGTPNTGEYANPRNEVWLDLTTDATGAGHAKAVLPWQFRPGTTPQSVIIHRDHTSTDPAAGKAGTAGPKLACLDTAS